MDVMDIERQQECARGDRLRVLVVGAGVAGLSVAALLRRRGLHPVLIERGEQGAPAGYMLALMPLVDGVLDELDCWDAYRAVSEPLRRYALDDHRGRRVRADSMADVIGVFGDYRGLDRGSLMRVLAGDECPVAYRTTVTALTEGGDQVTATLAGPGGSAQHAFDLVVVADGLHSATRALLPGARPVARLDTGWGGWVVWVPQDDEPDQAEELWGAGFFAGAYPVRGRKGAFVGASRRTTAAGPRAFVAGARRRLTQITPLMDTVLHAVAEEDDPYYWPLTDCRASAWTTGRTVLLGDAAAGFLPTAGIGAGMAMESAWVLAHALQGVRPEDVPAALRSYERAQRPRVETAQDNSRTLARLMFHDSVALAIGRDLAVRRTSIATALKPIIRLLRTSPHLQAARSVSVPR